MVKSQGGDCGDWTGIFYMNVFLLPNSGSMVSTIILYKYNCIIGNNQLFNQK